MGLLEHSGIEKYEFKVGIIKKVFVNIVYYSCMISCDKKPIPPNISIPPTHITLFVVIIFGFSTPLGI